jgi:hypothetical protein
MEVKLPIGKMQVMENGGKVAHRENAGNGKWR